MGLIINDNHLAPAREHRPQSDQGRRLNAFDRESAAAYLARFRSDEPTVTADEDGP